MSRSRRKSGGQKAKTGGTRKCCGPPVPTVAPRTGRCLSPEECARTMKMLADPNRIRIIRALLGGGLNVGETSEATGIDAHRVSHHLGRMRLAGLVESRRDGRNIVYSIHPGIASEWGLDLGCACILFRSLG